MVYNLSDPNDAMEFWIKMFSDVYNKHAPFKAKRVKQKAKPKQISKSDVLTATKYKNSKKVHVAAKLIQ